MSTITLEIEPKLFRQAENVLNSIGLKYSEALNLFNRQVVLRNAFPLELKGKDRPNIPCIDDTTTDEEIIRLFEEGMEQIEAGNYYTADEVEAMMEEHYAKF